MDARTSWFFIRITRRKIGGIITVVSISLNESYLQALDDIQIAYDLEGRSEAVRLAISAALNEMHDLDAIEGPVEGVLIIVRGDHADPWMIQIQAKYQDAIKTQLHSHLKDNNCLEVMVVSCSSIVLRAMMAEIRAQDKAKYIKFVRE